MKRPLTLPVLPLCTGKVKARQIAPCLNLTDYCYYIRRYVYSFFLLLIHYHAICIRGFGAFAVFFDEVDCADSHYSSCNTFQIFIV